LDLSAEWIVQSGGIAEGTVRVSVARSRSEDCPLAVADGTAHVKLLTRAIHIWTLSSDGTDETDELSDADRKDKS
jgi:hypothetical protein